MISTEFAPNEQWDDALLSTALLFQPWRWRTGPELAEVRSAVGAMVGERPEHVHLFLSGRAGLYHIFKHLDLPKGTEVLVTGFTCEAVVLPLLALGLVPVYNDVSQTDYSINPNGKGLRVGRKTRALLIQHTFGIPPQRKELTELAQKHNLIVVEDLAHGFEKDVFVKDSVQTIKLLSFGRSKSWSSVFGGAVVTGDRELNNKLAGEASTIYDVSFKDLVRFLNYKPISVFVKSCYSVVLLGKVLHKIVMSIGLLVPEISAREKRGEYDPYFDKKYPNALAILLLHQFAKFGRARKNRQLVVSGYRKALKGKIQDDYCLARYPVLVKDRSVVLKELSELGVYLGKWYTQPVAPAGLNLKHVGYELGTCPESEFICNHIVNLPTNVSVEVAEEIAKVVQPYVLS